ncbi:MAG: translocation/assembly module TamB domain-containing protein [Myxococcota bacterium]
MIDGRRASITRRRLLAFVATLLAAPVALTAALGAQLAAPGGRERVCAELRAQSRQAFVGAIEARCIALGPGHFALADVAVAMDDAPVLTAGAVEAELDLAALAAGTIALRRLRVRHARVSLRQRAGGLALAQAFAPRSEGPADAAGTEAGAAPSLPPFRVDLLALEEVRFEDADALVPGVGPIDVALEAALSGRDQGAVVDVASLRIASHIASLPAGPSALPLALAGDGTVRLGAGAQSTVALRGSAGDSRAELALEVTAGERLLDAPAALSATLALAVAAPEAASLGLVAAPFEANARLSGPLTAPRLDATLGPGAAPDALRLEVEATLDDAFVLRSGTLRAALGEAGAPADLRSLVPGSPASLAGQATLALDFGAAGLRERWWQGLEASLEARDLRLDALSLPRVKILVRGRDDALHLERLAVYGADPAVATAPLEATGRWAVAGPGAGDGEFALRLALGHLERAPGLASAFPDGRAPRGQLHGSVDLVRSGNELRARARLRAQDIVGLGVELREGEISLDAEGAPGRPKVALEAALRGVSRAGAPRGELRRLRLRLRGGPRGAEGARYEAELAAATAAHSLRLSGDARLTTPLTAARPAGTARLSGRLEGLWRRALALGVRRVRWEGDRVSLEGLTVDAVGGDLALRASASLRGSRGRAELRAEGLQLGALAQAGEALAPGLGASLRARLGALPSGLFTLDAEAQGTLAAPTLALRVEGVGLVAGPVQVPRLALRASHESRRRGARAEGVLELTAAGAGSLRLEASIESERRRLAGLLADPEARARAELLAPGIDLGELAERANALGAELPPLGGVAILDARASGSPAAIREGRISLRGVALRIDHGDAIDLDLTARLGSQSGAAGAEPFALDVAVADREGTVLDAHAEADVAALLTGGSVDRWLASAPFRIEARLPPRRLDALPRPFDVPLATRAGGRLALHAEAGQLPVGQLELDADYLGFGRCRDGGVAPALALRVALTGTEARAALDLSLAGEPALSAQASTPAPLRRWMAQGMARPPPLTIHGGGEGVPLAQLPLLCRQLEGTVDLAFDGTGLGTEQPTLEASLTAEASRVPVSRREALQPLRLEARAALVPDAAQASVRVRDENTDVLEALLRVPLRIRDGLPHLDDGRDWSARLEATDAPVAPLLAAVPDVVDPSGEFTGQLRLTGRGEAIASAEGELRLDAVALTVREPFQRIQRLDGRVALEEGPAGRDLVVDDLRLRDRDGRARLDGRLTTDGLLRPTAAVFTLAMRGFPVRDEGIPMAHVDADARLDARVRDARAVVDVRVRNAAVAVPPDEGREALGLRPHPDVTYESEPGFGAGPFAGRRAARAGPAPDGTRPEDSGPAPAGLPERLRLRFRSSPFFVRRDDFAIQLEPDVTLRVDEDGATLGGPVRVRRGNLELLGKTFELERGEILFTGAATIDPELDLRAVHALAGGETVGVEIGGTLERPELAFTSSEEGLTEQEILDRLVRGRSSGAASETADDQARSVLAGLTAGVLSSLARRRFGSYVPVLAIESDGASQAQVRAGFTLDRLIPSWLEPVLEGIYVEGVFGVAGEDEESEGGRASFSTSALIELLFPRRFVGTALVDQQANWSLDLSWEP